MIDFNVDQFTLTIMINEDEYIGYDDMYFEYIQERFSETLKLVELFGEPVHLNYGDGWYNNILDFGYADRHLFFKYNDENIENHISVVFHAEMLKEYLKSYRNKIDKTYNIFKMIKKLHTLGSIRFSRLDIAIDLINEEVVVDDLANQINNYDVVIKNSRNALISVDSIQQIGSGGKTETMYVNKRKSASFLRIYDKKIEAMLKESADLTTAIECDSWTRIELELKKYYAHNISELILNCETEEEFNKILIGTFIEKFTFLEVDNNENSDDEYIELPFYQKLQQFMNGEKIVLKGHERKRVTELEQKYNYMLNNGSMRLFAMIKKAYGEEGLREVFELINKDCEKIELNRDHFRLIDKFKKETPFFKE
ncbi:replication initiation factor domain-containing protein [Staphylococcus warneri]|uniref:replication initiation factor domain-containing protein n=1 Tax=Staphylococcus warneri TaxID=1292 RepID=UPI0016796B7C|nr:replication initiation factor domain-containing protein [Staphylococcus warneri]